MFFSELRGALACATLVAAIAMLGIFVPATPAFADAALVATNPEEGVVLDEAPTEIILTFNEELIEGARNFIQITGPSGEGVATGEVETVDKTLSIQVSTETTGVFEVTWQAVSIDGHTISGRYFFGIGEGGVIPERGEPSQADVRNAQVISPAVLLSVAAIVAVIVAIILIRIIRVGQRNKRTGASEAEPS